MRALAFAAVLAAVLMPIAADAASPRQAPSRQVDKATEKAVAEAARYLDHCQGGAGFEGCMSNRRWFVEIYVAAMAGDLEYQRQVADALGSRSRVAIRPSQALACAWRTVIVNAGAAGLTDDDARFQAAACDHLSPALARQAEAQSERLLRQIQETPAQADRLDNMDPAARPPVARAGKPALDSTAEPLTAPTPEN